MTKQFDRDTWQTPDNVFNGLDKLFNFDTDLCASEENAKKPHFFTKEQDITNKETQQMLWRNNCFMNPPYSKPMPFIQTAIDLMIERQCLVVMLVHCDKSTEWYMKARKYVTHIIDIVGKRIGFINPETGRPGAGNPKGNSLLIFDYKAYRYREGERAKLNDITYTQLIGQ